MYRFLFVASRIIHRTTPAFSKNGLPCDEKVASVGCLTSDCSIANRAHRIVRDAYRVLDARVLECLPHKEIRSFVSVVTFPSGGDLCGFSSVGRCFKPYQSSRIIYLCVLVAECPFGFDSVNDSDVVFRVIISIVDREADRIATDRESPERERENWGKCVVFKCCVLKVSDSPCNLYPEVLNDLLPGPNTEVAGSYVGFRVSEPCHNLRDLASEHRYEFALRQPNAYKHLRAPTVRR